MSRTILLTSTLLLLLLSATRVSAQEPAPPAPFVLPNGMRVVARERHVNSLVAIDLWVRAGAREETEAEAGSAHFLEHTLFKGTTTRGPGEIDIAIENLGAVLDAATGPDAAHFFTTVASAHLAEALAILADVVRNATLPAAEIERERNVILDELAQHDSDPTAHLVDLLYARALPDHPYHRSPGGTPDAIRARDRATLLAFYRRTYTPERCTLALVGDVTLTRALAATHHAFGAWKPNPPARTGEPNPNPFPTREGAINAESSPFPVSEANAVGKGAGGLGIGLAFLAPAAHDALMACAALVTVELLEGSPQGGRLAALRATADLSVRYTPRLDPSLFLLTATRLTPSTSTLAQLESAQKAEILRLQTTPPTPEEFALAKQRVLTQEQFRLETNAELARAIAQADLLGGDTPEAFRARVERLTADDLQRFLSQYLDPTRAVTVRVLP